MSTTYNEPTNSKTVYVYNMTVDCIPFGEEKKPKMMFQPFIKLRMEINGKSIESTVLTEEIFGYTD